MTCDGFILVPGVAPVARWRSHAQYSAPSRETLDGVNSLARALTAAFCGANQHNHGLLVSWALQGEGIACAPWYVRQRLRRASGRCGSCAALVFSFAPSIRLRGLKNVITITYRVKKTGEHLQTRLKSRIIISSKGEWPLSQ